MDDNYSVRLNIAKEKNIPPEQVKTAQVQSRIAASSQSLSSAELAAQRLALSQKRNIPLEQVKGADVRSAAITARATTPLIDLSKYVKLDTGEFVDKSEYDKLSVDEQSYLKENGTKAFNDKEQADLDEFKAANVLLDNGEYIDRKTFEALPSESQSYLKSNGIEAYNQKLDAELAQFKSSNIQLDNGEWVSNETYESLSGSDRLLLKRKGIDEYIAYKEKQAKDKQYAMSINAGIMADMMQDGQSAWRNQFISSQTQNVVHLSDGSAIPMAAWQDMTPEQQQILMDRGVEGYNAAIQSGEIQDVVLQNWVSNLPEGSEGKTAYDYSISQGNTPKTAAKYAAQYVNAVIATAQPIEQQVLDWVKSQPAGSDIKNAYDYSISQGNSPEVAAQYAVKYTETKYITSVEGAQAIKVGEIIADLSTDAKGMPKVVDLNEATQRLREAGIITSEQEVTGYGGNGFTISGIKQEIPQGTVLQGVIEYFDANPTKIDSGDAVSDLLAQGYTLQQITDARAAYEQITRSREQQAALSVLNASIPKISYTQDELDEIAIREAKGLSVPYYDYSAENLSNFIKANPDNGAATLRKAGFNDKVVMALAWDAYKDKPSQLLQTLNNAGYSNEQVKEYSVKVTEKLKYPDMPEYEGIPSLHDYIRDYLIANGADYTNAEIRANIASIWALGIAELSADKEALDAVAVYSDKYGVKYALQSGLTTAATPGFEPAREYKPGISFKQATKNVSVAQWATGAAQVLMVGALPTAGTAVGKVLQYAGQAAFGTAIAADWDNMTDEQRITSVALLVVSTIPDIVGTIPKNSSIGRVLNRDIKEYISKTVNNTRAYLAEEDANLYLATKYKELQNAVVAGDKTAIKFVTDDLNTFGKWAKVHGMDGADDILVTAKYFNDNAGRIAKNIDLIRESSVNLPNSMKDLYSNLENVIKKQELYSASATKIDVGKYTKAKEPSIVDIYTKEVRDPVTGRLLEGKAISDIETVLAKKHGLLTDIINTDISNKTIIYNGEQTTIKNAARSLNTSIGNTVKTQGWYAAEQVYGKDLMAAYNVDAAKYAATDYAMSVDRLPQNIVSRAKAKINAAEIQKEFIDNGGVTGDFTASTEIKGLRDVNGNEIVGFTVSDAVGEIEKLARSGKVTYIEQPGGYIKIIPSGELQGYTYITKDGIYVSPSIIENLQAYKDGLVRVVGESKFSLESLRQSALKPTTDAEIRETITNSISGQAYTKTQTGNVYTLSAEELARYNGGDLFLNIPSSALNNANTIKVSGANMDNLVASLVNDIKATATNQGIMAAIEQYGVTLVAAVYPEDINAITNSVSGYLLPEIVSRDIIARQSIFDSIKIGIAKTILPVVISGHLLFGVAQPVISAEVSNIEQVQPVINKAVVNTDINLGDKDITNITVNAEQSQNITQHIIDTSPLDVSNVITRQVVATNPTLINQNIIDTTSIVISENVQKDIDNEIVRTQPETITETIIEDIQQKATMPVTDVNEQTIPDIITQDIQDTIPQRDVETIQEEISLQEGIIVGRNINKQAPVEETTNITNAITPVVFPNEGKKTREEYEKEFQGQIFWRQGFGWWAIKPPYKTDADKHFFYGKEPPAGAVVVEGGAGAAYRSIQASGAEIPEEFAMDLGIMDVKISKPSNMPGAAGAITFTEDKEQSGKKQNIGALTFSQAEDKAVGRKSVAKYKHTTDGYNDYDDVTDRYYLGHKLPDNIEASI